MHRAEDALLSAKAAVRKLIEKQTAADAVAPITEESIRRSFEISEALRKAQNALNDAEILAPLCLESSGVTEASLCRAVESAAARAWSEWKGSNPG